MPLPVVEEAVGVAEQLRFGLIADVALAVVEAVAGNSSFH